MLRHDRPARWFIVLAVHAACFLSGCSLLLDSGASQCDRDLDCARFGQAVCDVGRHICVAALAAGEDGGAADVTLAEVTVSCYGPDGCLQCPATTDEELLSGCTDSTCVPFDNKRLTRLGADGTLAPLP